MPWGVAAAALSVAGTVYAADQQADAAQSAADTQAAGNATATAETRRQYDQTRADTQPYRDAGYRSLEKLNILLGLVNGPNYNQLGTPFTGANLASDPGYQFGLKQGQDTIENSLAARGGLYSGAAGKALSRYGQDYAGTKFNEAFNRDMQQKQLTFNQLSGLAGTGQTSVSQVGNLGANAATQIGQNAMGAGDAQAAAQLARGSAYGNAFNQVAGTGLNYFRQQQTGNVGYDPYAAGITNNSGSAANFNFTDPSYYGSGGFA